MFNYSLERASGDPQLIKIMKSFENLRGTRDGVMIAC